MYCNFFKEFWVYKYCNSILLCVAIFVLTLDHWEKLNDTLNIQTVTIKKTHLSSRMIGWYANLPIQYYPDTCVSNLYIAIIEFWRDHLEIWNITLSRPSNGLYIGHFLSFSNRCPSSLFYAQFMAFTAIRWQDCYRLIHLFVEMIQKCKLAQKFWSMLDFRLNSVIITESQNFGGTV